MDTTPDLTVLVHQERRSADVIRLEFEIKARDPSLRLNYVQAGSRDFHLRVDQYLRDVFLEIDEIQTLDHQPDEADERLEALGLRIGHECSSPELLEHLANLVDVVDTLQIQSEESWIPWELIKPDREAPFLGESFALTRWFQERDEHLVIPVRKLALVVPESSKLQRRDDEQNELESLESSAREVSLLSPRRQPLLFALREEQFDAIHFCGHSSRPTALSRWSLGLDDRHWLAPTDLLRGTRPPGPPKLVYFNSCHSAGTVLTPSGTDGWAERFVDAGFGAFLGSMWAIGDTSALELARAFYRGFLREDLPIGEAARRTRLEARAQCPGDPSWLSLAVFAHPLATARRPQELDPVHANRALERAESFALLRCLELDAFAPGDRISVRYPASATLPDLALVILDGDLIDEVWGIYAAPPPPERVLPTLSWLTASYDHGGKSRTGLVLDAELHGEIARWATVFDLSASHRWLDPELRDVLLHAAETSLALSQIRDSRLWRTATRGDDDERVAWSRLGRHSLRGLSLEDLQRRVLDRVARKLDLETPLDGRLEDRFDAATSVACAWLRRKGNQSVTTRSLLARLTKTARPHAEAPEPDEEERALRRFLDHNWQLLKKGVQGHSIELGDLWIAPKARLRPREDGPQSSIVDVAQWLRDELETGRSLTLVLGDFGHGKTTLLRYLTATLSARWTPGQPIPVFLVLREVQHPTAEISEMVAEVLKPFLRMTDGLWRRHRWILFCDGFDEMSLAFQHRMDWVSLSFSNFVRETRRTDVQVVLSSRPILFLDPMRRRETVERFDHLMLLPFDDHQVRSWLEHWSRHESPITFESLEERDLVEVARTPVLLTMIALIFHQRLQDLAAVRNRAEVYSHFFDWTAQWGGLPEPGDGPKQRVPENYRRILQEAAWLMFSHPAAESGLIPYEVLQAELAARLRDAETLDEEIEVDERIFVAHAFHERRRRHLEFIHQSLREYLVAEKALQVFRQIGTGEDWEWSLPVIELQANRPLTRTKLVFFRELVETMPVDELQHLAVRAENLWYWPALLYALIQQAPDNLTRAPVFSLDDGQLVTEETQVLSPSITVGNLALLGFVFEAVIKQRLDVEDSSLPSRLHGLSLYLSSDSGCEPLLDILRQSVERMRFRDLVFRGIDFSLFRLEDNVFERCRFIDCRFEESSLRGSRFASLEGTPTVFERCTLQALRRFDVHLEGVEFDDCRLELLQGQSGTVIVDVTWRRCHFKQCGIAHFYRRGSYDRCLFEDTRPLSDLLPIPESVEAEFEGCMALHRGGSWTAIQGVSDLLGPGEGSLDDGVQRQ
ncbi:MAG: CHAT domain-containing protein [Acidobacteriota bacterium]